MHKVMLGLNVYAPGEVVKVPAGHAVHEVGDDQNDEVGHCVHGGRPVEDVKPGAHKATHCEAAEEPMAYVDVPLGQALQLVWPCKFW